MKKPKIAIVNYQAGNLRSVQKAFEAIGCSATVTRSPHVIDDASQIIDNAPTENSIFAENNFDHDA